MPCIVPFLLRYFHSAQSHFSNICSHHMISRKLAKTIVLYWSLQLATQPDTKGINSWCPSSPLGVGCVILVYDTFDVIHSCQPLLGVNLSPEFVNLYFPYAGWGLLFFRWWQRHFEFQPAHVAVEEAMLCETHMHDFKSHF